MNLQDAYDSPRDAALAALAGDPDDVRTFLAIAAGMGGALDELGLRVHDIDGYTIEDALTKVARAWDGFDAAEDVRLLRDAYSLLKDRLDALTHG